MYKLSEIEKKILKDQICHYYDYPCEVTCDTCFLNCYDDCFKIFKQVREEQEDQ